MTGIAKVFQSGRSQALRIPKEYRFEKNELIINRIGNTTILTPKNDPWKSLVEISGSIDKDFMNDRNQGIPEERS